jgi:hypothetical protein
MKSKLDNVNVEIENIETLNNVTKNDLYGLWANVLSATNETKNIYMQRMMFQAEDLAAEGNAVITDEGLSFNDQKMLAMLICQKYPINEQASIVRAQFF